MAFVRVPAGSFLMGTRDIDGAAMERPDGEAGPIRDETPAHRVRITRPFDLGRTEVTQGQWLEVMGTRPGPESHWFREDWRTLPAVAISWNMAQRFARELGRLDPEHRYRLPTEAEWEYAARAGSEGLRPFPVEELERHAWLIDNSGDEPQPVGTRAANGFGVHDMLGNAWEWTADWYDPRTYAEASRVDPRGPDSGIARVRRGGSYHCPAHLVRPGYRAADDPGKRYSVLGFRLVREPAESPGASGRGGPVGH
jgi:formylglycine-generating enzyme required for sulfatase activity